MKFHKNFLFILIFLLLTFPQHSSLEELKDNLELSESSILNADLNVHKSNLTIAGQVKGKIKLEDGSIRVLGKVKNISVKNGDIFLAKDSTIEDDVLCVNGSVYNEGAHLGGTIHEIAKPAEPETKPSDEVEKKRSLFDRILVKQIVILILLSLLTISTIILSSMSSKLFQCIRVIQFAIEMRPMRCLAKGALGFFFWLFVLWTLPILLYIMSLKSEIFQLLYLPVMYLILLPFLLTGLSASLNMVGKKILKIFDRETDKYIIESIVGWLFTAMTGFIPVVGWLLWICVSLFGIGGSFISVLGTTYVMPKVKLRSGERRRSTDEIFRRKRTILIVINLIALLWLPVLVSSYLTIYTLFPGILGLAKPELSVEKVYSVQQLDFVQDHFRLEMEDAYLMPFYLAKHKAGVYIKGDGRYFFSLNKDVPAQVEGNIAETRLSEVFVYADSEEYFTQLEKEENVVSEDVDGMLRDAKESLDRIEHQIGKDDRFLGFRRKRISDPKINVFGLRLHGRDRGEALVYREFADVIRYHSISFGVPSIEIYFK